MASNIDKKLVEQEVGSKISKQEEIEDFGGATRLEFKDGKEYLVFSSYEDAKYFAERQVERDIEDEPEMFNKDFINGFVDKRRAVEDIRLTIENDSGWYEQFESEEEPETDEDYEKLSDWADEKANEIVENEEYEDYNIDKNRYLNLSQAAENAIQTDGVAHFLSSYDGEEVELDNGNVMYRTN